VVGSAQWLDEGSCSRFGMQRQESSAVSAESAKIRHPLRLNLCLVPKVWRESNGRSLLTFIYRHLGAKPHICNGARQRSRAELCVAMGVRFDKWLARPSTLHFLRQLIGPEPAAVRTIQPHWNKPPGRYSRCYSTAQSVVAIHKSDCTSTDQESLTAVAAASNETSREQRERVAKELGLRIPREDDYEHIRHRTASTPSSTSYSDLLYSEARVRDVSTARGLLIDQPVNHANLEAWCKILEYRERTDGFAGVLDVWAGMRKRGIDLPVDGPHADVLWNTLLRAAIIREHDRPRRQLLREIFAHAKDLKAAGAGHYRSFHKVLMGRFLRTVPVGAGKASRSKAPSPMFQWHRAACEAGFGEAGSLPFLVLDVLKSNNPRTAFARWQKLYHHDKLYFRSDKSEMYDLCMPLVLLHAVHNPALVISWHNFLLENNEVPSPELATNRSVKYLLGATSSDYVDASAPDRLDPKGLTAILMEDRGDMRPPTSPLLSRASMSGLVGDVHGIKPKVISDKFCARMFATQAFSLETSIRGLALLGTEVLGPIALRELAVRAGTPEKLKERLADVKDAGIAISPSRYAHVLKTVVANSQTDLFQTLLTSDQHPESYDDQHTQQTLLTNFLQAENLPLVHITLISLSDRGTKESSRVWNRLLQHYTKSQNHQEVVRIFDHICAEQLFITARSLNFMMKYLLPARAPSKSPMLSQTPTVAGFDRDNFVVNAHMYAASHGQVNTPDRWIELLKRYGMTGKIDGVERLIHWLVRRYPSVEVQDEYVRSDGRIQRLHNDISTQAKIFRPVMLRAIIVWGFRFVGIRDGLQPSIEEPSASMLEAVPDDSWTRGIALVLQLKKIGLDVQTKDVRRAVTGILWTLFGPGVSKRRINLSLIQSSQLTIMDYVKDANNAWDEPLFEIPVGPDGLTTEAQVLRVVFGEQRLASQVNGDWVDVVAWAAAKDEGSWYEAPPNLQDRHQAWSQSAFRFKDNFDTRRQRQVANWKKDPFGLKRLDAHYDGNPHSQITPPQSQQRAAQPSNWRPLPSQPSTLEEP
jgi:hypothetical protein